MEKIGVLFVCTGNICRSPSADGVFRHLVQVEGIDGQFTVDSAGTHGYHVGEPPDRRSTATAFKRGYDLTALRARRLVTEDFERFEYVLAMDDGHYAMMLANCPTDYRDRLYKFVDFAPDFEDEEVPDPYYGGDAGFEHVLDLVENGCHGLLAHIRHTHGV